MPGMLEAHICGIFYKHKLDDSSLYGLSQRLVPMCEFEQMVGLLSQLDCYPVKHAETKPTTAAPDAVLNVVVVILKASMDR